MSDSDAPVAPTQQQREYRPVSWGVARGEEASGVLGHFSSCYCFVKSQSHAFPKAQSLLVSGEGEVTQSFLNTPTQGCCRSC